MDDITASTPQEFGVAAGSAQTLQALFSDPVALVLKLEKRIKYLSSLRDITEASLHRMERDAQETADSLSKLIIRELGQTIHRYVLNYECKTIPRTVIDDALTAVFEKLDLREKTVNEREGSLRYRAEAVKAAEQKVAEARQEIARERIEQSEWRDAPNGVVYELLRDGEVVYVGESLGTFSRMNGHTDKNFDTYRWMPAPAGKSERMDMESALIHQHEAETGRKPEYNKGYH